MTRHRLDHVERPRLRPEAAEALDAWVAVARADLGDDDQARLLDRAREQVAFHVGARSHEVVFTSGATESATTAVAGLLARRGGGHVICSNRERPSLHAAVQRHATVQDSASSRAREHSESSARKEGRPLSGRLSAVALTG